MQRHATVATTVVLAAPASPDAQLVEESAALLRRAEAGGHLPAEGWGRIPVAPLTEEYEDLDLAGAYAAQEANVRIRLAAGEHLAGRKVGLTSLPMREQLGLPEASFGTLFQSMVIPDGGTIDTRELITPRAEAEVGLVLGRRLSGPRVTDAEVRAAVSQVAPTMEIIDSRITDWRVSQADTVDDNASSARVAVGRSVDATDDLLTVLRDECVGLCADGERVTLGLGAEVLGDPLRAVAWPARTLHAHGSALHPGELLLHRVCARRRPPDTGLSARRAVRHRPPARTGRDRPMNHHQGCGGAAMPPREPERSDPSGVHMNARRTTSPRWRRSARPIRPEEAQR
ncbi:2-keto-4-pentenoate hydratase [Streptomyces sp. TLI_185]|uniref:2-keto-4-pentenoate hydratase n=1 Tax=Streptomyces sp. TLI_185 TaxID=2485151 RepID=UPI000F4F4217|nr:fumarylacetoacetate hydrolase family protein [Streptomyces sp. TLI_185]RPF38527.1 2-keto-4-pentenoate hydratase [Streptomyces sp. TLI_185]